MRVFIAGATGVLGRRLVRRLADDGHEVVGLARSPASAGALRALGGRPASADLFDADALARAAEGAEVVIHAATRIPIDDARSRAAWVMNDRIRREGTRALASAAGRVGARRYLQQSVVWAVRTPDGSPYSEETPPDPSPLVRSALDGEEIARAAGAEHGFAVGILRCGVFYGGDTAHTRSIAALLRRRRLPIVGSGRTLLAPLHADDAASAFAAAALTDRAGLWHVVDDEPVALATFLRTFAELLGAPPPRRVPVWLARLLAGRLTVEALTTSMPTSNAKFRREVGWAPRYPTYREGLPEVIATLRGEQLASARPPVFQHV